MNERAILGIFGCFGALFLMGIGFMMRHMDFGFMFQSPWAKDDGLYLGRMLPGRKIADNTPENRKKYSRYLGNYFIGFSLFFLGICLCMIFL